MVRVFGYGLAASLNLGNTVTAQFGKQWSMAPVDACIAGRGVVFHLLSSYFTSQSCDLALTHRSTRPSLYFSPSPP